MGSKRRFVLAAWPVCLCIYRISFHFTSIAALTFILLFFLEMQSAVRQNLHTETEADLNKLIKLKLTASYTYLALVRLAYANVDC